MTVVVCRMTLMAGHCRSLKDKRSVVRKLKDRVEAKFHIRMAEVGGLDSWQRAQLGFSVVSNDAAGADGIARKIVAFVDTAGVARVTDCEHETLRYGDESFGNRDIVSDSDVHDFNTFNTGHPNE